MKKTPGPKPTDVSLRTRNRLWAWLVYYLTPGADSWQKVDDFWLKKIDEGTPTDAQASEQRGRRRTFERYFHDGHDPGALKGINSKWLKDVVHEDPRIYEAKALYESLLWDLTGPVELPMERVVEIHGVLLAKLGLIRMTPMLITYREYIINRVGHSRRRHFHGPRDYRIRRPYRGR
ncbi:hypothetical protein [Pseudoxanthomonas kalamensis]|uniref:hypothetical protein n=1 Tax=Pseudoxanthomonas kalamensis TaxID=289483 RepID=UPI0013917605|nr:hypothetical protein [Pseudoxanthomonas kalamensis]